MRPSSGAWRLPPRSSGRVVPKGAKRLRRGGSEKTGVVAVQQRGATNRRVTFEVDRVQGRNAHFVRDSGGSDAFSRVLPDRRRCAYIVAARSETKRAGEGRRECAPALSWRATGACLRAPSKRRKRRRDREGGLDAGRRARRAVADAASVPSSARNPNGHVRHARAPGALRAGARGRPAHVGWSGHRLRGMLEAGCFATGRGDGPSRSYPPCHNANLAAKMPTSWSA